jgi:uncharacterized protein
MATLQDITSADWQLSLTEGEVVQDFADIQQCIFVILTTEKGTDPTRPDFGCGVYTYIDKPVNFAVPNMKREIAQAIATYERRVKIIRILHTVEEGKVTFKIEWKLSNTTGETTVSYGTGS